MTVPYEQVVSDPRVVRIPAGFSWSRKLLAGEAIGKWCLIYETKFVNITASPPEEGWSRKYIDLVVSKMRLKAEEETTMSQLRMLEGPMGGSA